MEDSIDFKTHLKVLKKIKISYAEHIHDFIDMNGTKKFQSLCARNQQQLKTEHSFLAKSLNTPSEKGKE